ncbi:MAG: DNA-binding GntR family transcriptional regulator [Loktanella salsilacus]|jgi:DNA-binding GntR family transcriptional regulator|uniref:Transcriptional regulator, GntR family n=1 Tax=Loktanella salsilacus TaxID=195913 RepID=A0A1I4G4F6_9RHOB|nr:GntR family transcriptional regulator [Loktanella salsilacus]MBU0779504.1 GntR family transcriptional regulator [Alphaproteobacteria bacterium]MBU1838062.1 GntR family transcriptional regulator [Alphaproteobacteria bacterium]UTH44772.1 GntR family transcriptional regulator [Loktanella salsilacus]UTH48496.1 GntR family transcriptional regulator [Loktanella salsilacus]SFL24553.1 transcriptional regulator, GntR family [Loktanella salsilacus]|tara:strand:+ start:7738 stop:8385 length:648 start_codon:yes stop_codon:yes gene_type:complete
MIQPRPIAPPGAAHDRVFRALRTRILHGQIAPGTTLTLRGIAKEYEVSMTPAREAVRRLASEGALSLSATGRVSTPLLSNERIEELATLRALLEPELASRALPRAHFALIERLEAINHGVSQMVTRHDASGYIRMNLEFHRTLYLRAQAPAILAMTETVWLQLGPTMCALYGKLNRTDPPTHHRLIVAALKAGDEPGLRLAVRGDVTKGLRLLKT